MKRISTAALLLFCCMAIYAQRTGFDYRFSGFVDPQLFMDSRQVVGAREGQLSFYPAPRLPDVNGNDLNAVPNLNMLAITTRLGLRIQAPDWGATKVSSYLEGDFTGSNEAGINMLRLRHAYISLQRERSEWLFGQYWHPLVVPDIMPGTRPLNMGIPFHPYSRYVQGRYLCRSSASRPFVQMEAVAAFQLDNASAGPYGKSTAYLRAAALPEGNLQLRYVWGERVSSFLGCMFNAEVLRPRNYFDDAAGLLHRTSTTFPSFTVSLFGCHDYKGWSLRYQGIYGDNLFEQGLLGGYLETRLPQDAGYAYTPFGCTSLWADFRRICGRWRPGIFLGYTQNNSFGSWFDADVAVYGRGFDIDNVWRVQPQLAFCPNASVAFFTELEYTSAKYGEKLTNGNSFRYLPTDAVGNLRIILEAVFYF